MLVWARVSRVWAGGAVTSAIVGAWMAVLLAVPAAPTLNPPAVAGPQVTLSWSAVPGALGYRLSIGVAPGAEQFAQIVGPVTSVTFAVPFTGTGYVRAQAIDATGLSAPSNEVVLTVTSLTPVPAAPVNLQSFVNGRTVTFTWGPGTGGGAPLGVLFEAGTAPGLRNLGAVPLPLSTSGSLPNVPPGTYFARVYAVNASGRSAPSNEVRVDVPVAGGCSLPPILGDLGRDRWRQRVVQLGCRPWRGGLSPGGGDRPGRARGLLPGVRGRHALVLLSERTRRHLLRAHRQPLTVRLGDRVALSRRFTLRRRPAQGRGRRTRRPGGAFPFPT